jgi:hypothetical protein
MEAAAKVATGVGESRRRKRKSPLKIQRAFLDLAERTGLEPATPGVTGRYSNQLNYRSSFLHRGL